MSKTLLTLGLAGAMAAGAAGLQSNLKVTVPFEFNAGRAVLPAGEYWVERQPVSDTLVIRNVATAAGVFVRVLPTESHSQDTRARMVFRKYGDHYFLAEIWNAGSATGAAVPKSKREREMMASVPFQLVILASWK